MPGPEPGALPLGDIPSNTTYFTTERRGLQVLVGAQARWYNNIIMLVKFIADGLVVAVALVGAYALLRYVPNNEKYQTYARILMAGLTAYVAAKVIGFFYQPHEQRPFEALGVDAGASFLNNPGFPSDHALFVVAITLAVWFATRQKWLALTCLVLSVLVCVGRVLALVHTPLDVIGGAVIACLGVVWYIDLAKRKQKLSK